jgi:DNA repair exonuclease SbcCD ATPase subunit
MFKIIFCVALVSTTYPAFLLHASTDGAEAIRKIVENIDYTKKAQRETKAMTEELKQRLDQTNTKEQLESKLKSLGDKQEELNKAKKQAKQAYNEESEAAINRLEQIRNEMELKKENYDQREQKFIEAAVKELRLDDNATDKTLSDALEKIAWKQLLEIDETKKEELFRFAQQLALATPSSAGPRFIQQVQWGKKVQYQMDSTIKQQYAQTTKDAQENEHAIQQNKEQLENISRIESFEKIDQDLAKELLEHEKQLEEAKSAYKQLEPEQKVVETSSKEPVDLNPEGKPVTNTHTKLFTAGGTLAGVGVPLALTGASGVGSYAMLRQYMKKDPRLRVQKRRVLIGAEQRNARKVAA